MRRWIPLFIGTPMFAVAVAGVPLGDMVDPALTIDITPQGFDALGGALPALIPGSLPLDDIGTSGRQTERVCVFFFCQDIEIAKWSLNVVGLEVHPTVDAMKVTPVDGALEIQADLRIGVNADTDPATTDVPAAINIDATFLYFLTIKQQCTIAVDPFPVGINARMEMEVIDDGLGNRSLDVTIPDDQFGWSWDPSGQDIKLGGSNCLVADIRDLLTRIGWDPLDLVLDLAEGEIDSAVRGFVGDLETTVEEAFNQANIQQDIALGDSTMSLTLQPSQVAIVPEGLRLDLEAGLDVPMHPCVASYGYSESGETPSAAPAIGSAPSDLAGHHIGAFASDEFINAALFSVWSSGMVCQTITADAGLPINTSLLGLLSKEAFDPLFPETDELIIETRPYKPLTASFDGAAAVTVHVEELGLDMYAPLEHRFVRILGNELETDVGIDLIFDETIGELAVEVDLDPSAIGVTVVHNEFAGEFTSEIEESFGGLFDAVVGPLVGSLLSDLAFPLPAFEGIGLTSFDTRAAGPAGDNLGIYANVGLVTYEAGGCDSDGGGCEGGCAAGAPARPILFLFPLALAFLRRRRQD